MMVCNIEYGFVDVEAETLEEAENKAQCLDGDYYINNNDVECHGLIEILNN